MFNVSQTKRPSRHFAIAASVLLLPFGIGTLQAANVSSLLQEAKMSANQLKTDAVQMESFSRSKQMNWQSHASQISQIKEHINKAGKVAAQLEEAKGSAKKFHQTSIEHIVPTLQELASNTEAIIDHLNKTPNHLWNPTYKEYLASNAELAGELSQLIDDAVAYDKTKTEMESLHERLDKLTE